MPVENENIEETNITPNFVPMDYVALEFLSWFNADYQNLQNRCNTLFRGGMQTDAPIVQDLIVAIKKSIFEIQEDITNIQNRLQIIIDQN